MTHPAGPQKPSASTPHQTSVEMVFWRFSDLAGVDQRAVLLRSSKGVYGTIDTAVVRRMLEIGERMFRNDQSGSHPELVLLASGGVNGFAFHAGEQATIAVSRGMIDLLANDDDAWAALIGHELAHLRLEHIRKRIDRRQRDETLSSVAGAMLSAIGLPFASLATDVTATLADRAFSRDDERDADRVGMEYMRQAGFDIEGAVRLQQKLLHAGADGPLSFLSTHPGGEERITNLRRLMQASH
ncbi:MAG: M48 family metalloprotease [Rhodocyclales bacterium]|nr:M48 family metalloprotease [Rhodocyclales bacterium]